MLELFVYLLCGSILVSGLLAIRLGNTLAAAVSGGAGQSVCRGLLRLAGCARCRNDGGVDRLGPVDSHFPLCDPQDDRESTMMELIGSILVLLGAIFHFSAGLGMLRMPDAYTRMQAGTKACTLGNTLVLSGLGDLPPGVGAEAVDYCLFRPDDKSYFFARAGPGSVRNQDSNGRQHRH